eukprot:TRINITY_DN29980_c0_g1_i1.p1 TRINITY_DN29980_c0_g1~~TRINITY_DN29980_c0_g1_i1.p1  ORF type:complete len:452 (-),score=126.81 TRINITY_DN29980_c0_g1_i1:16-1323(-)
MSHLFGCKQTPPTPPTTSDEDSSGSTDDAEMKKKKGNRAMGKKKYPKALKYYSKAIKIDPKNATYYLNRAIANSALELWKDAEGDASSAVELQEQPSSKSHYQLARARLRRGRCLEARDALRIGLGQCPGESALVQLSREVDRACAALEAKRKAQEEAEEAKSSAGPCGSRALTDQARNLYQAGRLEEALLLAEESRKDALRAGAKRDEINAVSLLGKIQMRLKRWPDAAESWQAVVDMETKEFSMDVIEERDAISSASNNLGIALKNAGKLEAAVSALNEAYQLSTSGDDKIATYQASQILQNVSQCLLAQGKPGEARSVCARAADICQRLFGEEHAAHALSNLCLARCLRADGQFREAVTTYAKALEVFSKKTTKECLAELPEVPSEERLLQLQNQCKGELAQLLALAEQAQARGTAATASEQAGYSAAATAS